MKRNSKSLVTQISLIVFGMTLFTAGLLGWGAQYRLKAFYALELRQRASFLADTLSAGIGNYLVLSEPEALVSPVADEVLASEGRLDGSMAYCRIFDRNGRLIYVWREDSEAGKGGLTQIVHQIEREGLSLGRVELAYRSYGPLEFERIRQVRSMSDTLGALVAHYYRSGEFFQIESLLRSSLEKDPNILYAAIMADGEVIAKADYDSFQKKFPDALSYETPRDAGRGRDMFIRNLGALGDYGEAIEVRYPLVVEGERIGEMRLGYSMASLETAIRRMRLLFSLMLLALGFTAIGAALAASRRFARPILELAHAADELSAEAMVGRGPYGEAERELQEIVRKFEELAGAKISRQDEVGLLALSIQRLMQGLQKRVAELRHIYQNMSQTDRLSALGQLGAGIAHEINNPLSIISTTLQVMEKRGGMDEQSMQDLKIMQEEIDRIADKVKALLSFAQESSGEVRLLDVNAIVSKTLELTGYQMKKNKVELEMGLDDDLPDISGDERRIKQVFLNMIINAIQAMPGGGRLMVATSSFQDKAESEWVCVSFKDTGQGISEDVQARMFDPFFTTKGVSEGTGLGLAISYGIVQSHKGRIEVKSAPGEGAEFKVAFPAV